MKPILKRNKLAFILMALSLLALALGVMLWNAPAAVRAAETEHDHTDGNWTALTEAGGPLSGGNYYLNDDLTLTADLTIDGEVTLCLNGHVLTGTGSSSVITVLGNANFTLCDCQSESTAAEHQHAYYVDDDGLYVFDDGTDGWDTAYAAAETEEKGTIVGGVITGGKTTSNGGGVRVEAGGNFEMSGGTIAGISATGGGVYVGGSNAEFTMSGGTISGNKATNGGGVYVYYGAFKMTGGTIGGNSASMGGGVYAMGTNSTFTMSGGYFGGTIASNGGSISISGGYFAKEVKVDSSYLADGCTLFEITQDLGDENYNAGFPHAVYKSGTVDITALQTQFTYSGNADAFEAEAANDADISYSYSAEEDGPYTDGLPTAAGTWYIKAVAEARLVVSDEGKFYVTAEEIFVIEISPIQLVVDSIEVTKTAEGFSANYISISGIVENDAAEVIPAFEPLTDGRVKVTYSLSGVDEGNYIVPAPSYVTITTDLNQSIADIQNDLKMRSPN